MPNLVQSVFICLSFYFSTRPSHVSMLHVWGSKSAWSMWIAFDLLYLWGAFFSQKFSESLSRLSYGCLFHWFPCKIWVKPKASWATGLPHLSASETATAANSAHGHGVFPCSAANRRAFCDSKDADVHSWPSLTWSLREGVVKEGWEKPQARIWQTPLFLSEVQLLLINNHVPICFMPLVFG